MQVVRYFLTLFACEKVKFKECKPKNGMDDTRLFFSFKHFEQFHKNITTNPKTANPIMEQIVLCMLGLLEKEMIVNDSLMILCIVCFVLFVT